MSQFSKQNYPKKSKNPKVTKKNKNPKVMKKIPKKLKGTFHLLTRKPVNEKKSKGLSLGLHFRLLMRKNQRDFRSARRNIFTEFL